MLARAVEQKRLVAADAMEAFAEYGALMVPIIDTGEWITEALAIAVNHRISLFDALFLLTGMRLGARVVSDDERLVRAGGALGCNLIRLREYTLTT